MYFLIPSTWTLRVARGSHIWALGLQLQRRGSDPVVIVRRGHGKVGPFELWGRLRMAWRVRVRVRLRCVCARVYISIYLSIYLSIDLYIYTYVCVCLCVCVGVCICVCVCALDSLYDFT